MNYLPKSYLNSFLLVSQPIRHNCANILFCELLNVGKDSCLFFISSCNTDFPKLCCLFASRIILKLL